MTSMDALTHREPLRPEGLNEDSLAGAGQIGHGEVPPHLKTRWKTHIMGRRRYLF